MDTGGTETVETRKFKDAMLAEIFTAYQESGTVYQKTTDPEIQRTVQDLKRCFDLAIHRLSPLGVHAEQHWDELSARFSSRDTARDHRPEVEGLRSELED